jgi:hypothetical protein
MARLTTTEENGELVTRCADCPGWWNTGPGALEQHARAHERWADGDLPAEDDPR